MSERTEVAAWPTLSCEICLTEIPASEAKSPEVQDYLMYLCGLDCYGRWQARARTRIGQDIVQE